MGRKVKNLISVVIIILVTIFMVLIYNKYNYNDFMKSVSEDDKTSFTRDSQVKCSKMNSYKLENKDYNDAMFSQTISVLPNTPYKVTCKIKVENVDNINNNEYGGAHICINGTTERSNPINGTQDWQEAVFYFNSKNRTEVDIGFRLGGYAEKVKGTAWFSDFKIEAGNLEKDRQWNMICFIFPKIDVDVEVNGKTEHVTLEMLDNEINIVKSNLERFKYSIQEISKNKMSVNYETVIINEPITTLSYDEENGYYVSSNDVRNLIDGYIKNGNYDHIYVALRMADKQKRKWNIS